MRLIRIIDEARILEAFLILLVNDSVEFTEDPVVFSVAESTLRLLDKKGIHYQCLYPEEVVVYDLLESKYPREEGQLFRSKQVFECSVCGALTNKVYIGGWPNGVRSMCPQATECWHHDLQDRVSSLKKYKRNRRRELEFEISEIKRRRELEFEIAEVKNQHKTDMQNDLLGSFRLNQKRKVTNVRAFKTGQVCKHRLR